MPDPNIQLAVDEIEAILKKYDMMGILAISSATHMQHLIHVDTGWSCSKFVRDPDGRVGIHIRCKQEDFENKEAQKACLDQTLGSLIGFVDTNNRMNEELTKMLIIIGRKVGGFSQITAREDFPDSSSQVT